MSGRSTEVPASSVQEPLTEPVAVAPRNTTFRHIEIAVGGLVRGHVDERLPPSGSLLVIRGVVDGACATAGDGRTPSPRVAAGSWRTSRGHRRCTPSNGGRRGSRARRWRSRQALPRRPRLRHSVSGQVVPRCDGGEPARTARVAALRSRRTLAASSWPAPADGVAPDHGRRRGITSVRTDETRDGTRAGPSRTTAGHDVPLRVDCARGPPHFPSVASSPVVFALSAASSPVVLASSAASSAARPGPVRGVLARRLGLVRGVLGLLLDLVGGPVDVLVVAGRDRSQRGCCEGQGHEAAQLRHDRLLGSHPGRTQELEAPTGDGSGSTQPRCPH